MARNYKEKERLKGGVVGTIMSNLGLEEALQSLGIAFVRTPVGDRYVMEQLKASGWLLGGEPSGHIVHLGLTTTGDGIISALQILRIMLESEHNLHELKSDLKKIPQILINVPVKHPILLEKNTSIQSALAKIEKKLGHTGRVLLRASGTEPLIRVMLEGEDKEQIILLANELADVVGQQ
jgi:phosphoglucosamine mutase